MTIKFLPQLLSLLFFETGSLTKLEAHHFSSAAPAVSLWSPLLCSLVLELQTRSILWLIPAC